MALGMMLPGMAAGWIQDQIGYVNFFLWVLVATIPSFLATAAIYRGIPESFGRKSA
jgi:PAT family beta-lactamase induction signal transducer AmpG